MKRFDSGAIQIEQANQTQNVSDNGNIENIVVPIAEDPILEQKPAENLNILNQARVETKISLQENADSNHHAYPYCFLNKSLANGETCKRDWLCWSVEKQSLYCAPCFLFNKNAANVSFFSSSAGWGISRGWRRLKNRIPSHESSIYHKENYVVWKSASRAALCETSVDNLLLSKLKTETENWKKLFQRILDVIFLSERGLALFGSNQRIGDRANGNFLGITELLSKYNPLLAEHVKHVRESQQCKQRMQAHYLSMRIHNEFIDICGSHFQTAILHEIVKD
ncbi:uncharacterized protein LOC124808473 [Hydra vulgaris]|uniref:uncharacterized protein LOC124808473 n=1 Tax=Hydra vulgaris TaxID=6087 RepID=UPI001F5F6B79|nr:uncharacterized protein LOC124808473 [Hydra vulgaris]